MVEALRNRATTLAHTKDESGRHAWREVVRFYGPVIYGFARRQGLGDADAAELMREVLRGVAPGNRLLKYDPDRSPLRERLFAATRHGIMTVLSARQNRPHRTGDRGARDDAALDFGATTDSAWDTEYSRQLAARAMGLVKHEFPSSTWQAFWKTTVAGSSARDAGMELAMTPGAVHIARCRVLVRLREEVQSLRSDAEAW
ncbi:MAG TPA: sigma-70 family RNA polymerase sigma factor [Urbifossiella sp.]|jgi:RNA polymerase sigma-70 factor (ECF subfamily)|nr:sigma-70 family RNA polymerase sigma factor [Urbifossiella sp.]